MTEIYYCYGTVQQNALVKVVEVVVVIIITIIIK